MSIKTIPSGLKVETNKNYLILDRYGYPVETIKGRYVRNFIRYLIHGRKIVKAITVFDLKSHFDDNIGTPDSYIKQ